jgi:predicted RND superfamily exporter protein
MVIDFLITIFLQGAIRTELARRNILPSAAPGVSSHPVIDKIVSGSSRLSSRWISRYGRRILFLSAFLFLFFSATSFQIEREFDRKIFLSKSMPTYVADRVSDKYFGLRDHGYILFEGEVENPLLLQKMRLLEERMGRIPLIEKIFDKANVESVNELIDKKRTPVISSASLRSVLDQITTGEETANYVIDETYRESASHLVHKSGDRYEGLVMKFFVEGGKADQILAVSRSLEKEIDELKFNEIPGVKIQVGGGELSNYLDIQYFFTNFVQSFFLSFGINFIALLFIWRRWGLSLVAMIPIVISVVFTIGLMPLLGIELNVLNLSIGSIVVGVGIDYPIHFIERFQEEYRGGAVGRLQAAQAVLSSMGPDFFGGAFTTIVGFGASMVLAMPMVLSFGFLTALSIFFVYLATIFVLPVMLVRGKR